MPSLNMKELSKSLQEMITDASADASTALLFGAREAMFREIFIFHYPFFLDELHQQAPSILENEEVVCMLIALKQQQDEITSLLCLSVETVEAIWQKLHSSVEKPNELLRKRSKRKRVGMS